MTLHDDEESGASGTEGYRLSGVGLGWLCVSVGAQRSDDGMRGAGVYYPFVAAEAYIGYSVDDPRI